MDKKISFLGAGKMATTLINGLINKSRINPRQIIASDISADRVKFLTRKYKGALKTTTDNRFAVKFSDIIFLCVKPKDFKQLLNEISVCIDPARHLLVSIAAGITLKFIEKNLPRGTRVIRIMPNTPISVGEGVVFVKGGRFAKASDMDFVSKIFSQVALVIKLKNEELINSGTAISGSGPAYVYYFAEALRDAAVSLGFKKELAAQMALKTFSGASRMMIDGARNGIQFENLRADVTSPGGTTFAAISSFEKDKIKKAILRAVKIAKRRAQELSIV